MPEGAWFIKVRHLGKEHNPVPRAVAVGRWVALVCVSHSGRSFDVLGCRVRRAGPPAPSAGERRLGADQRLTTLSASLRMDAWEARAKGERGREADKAADGWLPPSPAQERRSGRAQRRTARRRAQAGRPRTQRPVRQPGDQKGARLKGASHHTAAAADCGRAGLLAAAAS